jgi:hypothetical protein
MQEPIEKAAYGTMTNAASPVNCERVKRSGRTMVDGYEEVGVHRTDGRLLALFFVLWWRRSSIIEPFSDPANDDDDDHPFPTVLDWPTL